GHVPRSLQQRFLRRFPPAAGADPQQLRGQKYPGLGHVQEDGGADLPQGPRSVLGVGGASQPQPVCCRARRGHAGVQAGAGAPGPGRPRQFPVLCQGSVPAAARLQQLPRRGRHAAPQRFQVPCVQHVVQPGRERRPALHPSDKPGEQHLRPVQHPPGQRHAEPRR
ncbi:hypothetical protein HGM15179_020657, partial [Zosterops borbonicus]